MACISPKRNPFPAALSATATNEILASWKAQLDDNFSFQLSGKNKPRRPRAAPFDSKTSLLLLVKSSDKNSLIFWSRKWNQKQRVEIPALAWWEVKLSLGGAGGGGRSSSWRCCAPVDHPFSLHFYSLWSAELPNSCFFSKKTRLVSAPTSFTPTKSNPAEDLKMFSSDIFHSIWQKSLQALLCYRCLTAVWLFFRSGRMKLEGRWGCLDLVFSVFWERAAIRR